MIVATRLALAVVLLSTLLGAGAQAQTQRLVCLVSSASGQVMLSPADGPQKILEIFTRLREGERLELPRGSTVQLAFLQRGISETWTGPATVLITAAGGQSPDAATPPATNKLPLAPRPTGAGSSILSQGGEQATAQIMTREVKLPEDKPLSDADRAKLAEVEQTVERMRQRATPGDVTPDIVLLEELSRLEQRRSLNTLLERLRAAYPDNATLAHWGE